MNTIEKIALGVVIVAVIALGAIALQGDKLGAGAGVNRHKTATNDTITCSGATSTVVLVEASNTRTSFELTVASSTDITLCKKSAGCVIGSGLTIKASGGSYTETVDYFGAYSCIGNTVSSTIGIIYNQR